MKSLFGLILTIAITSPGSTSGTQSPSPDIVYYSLSGAPLSTSTVSVFLSLTTFLPLHILHLFAISMIVSKLNHDYLNQFRYAVVVKERVGIRQDPKIENLEIDYLSEGVTVKLLDQKDGWSYIELPNKLVGWVLSPMIEKI